MAQAIPMATATLLAGLPEFVGAELGERALRRAYSDAGLHTGFGATPGVYIPEAAIMALMNSAARQAGDGALGALFGTHVNLGIYDTWGPYILEAPTLGDCLKRFQAVMRFVASHSVAWMDLTGHQAHMNYRWAGRRGEGYAQVCLATAGSLLNTLRRYLGAGFLPDEIHLDIARPADAAVLNDHLPTRIVFGADQISLRFPRRFLRRPRPGPVPGQPVTLSQVRRHVLSGPPGRIEDAVTELVRVQVLNGGPSFDRTARALGLNQRTLRRILDRRGEGFRTLSTRIRMDLAEELLRETDLPVRVISERVGYADPFNFSRAFTRRFGQRPTQARGSDARAPAVTAPGRR